MNEFYTPKIKSVIIISGEKSNETVTMDKFNYEIKNYIFIL